MRRIYFYQSLVNCHQAALPHISVKKCGLLAIDGGQLKPDALLAFFAELNGTREGQVAEIEQAVVIEGHGRLGQEGMTDDAEADAPVQRVLAGEGCQGVEQGLGQLMQLGHVALGHHIEQVAFAQVVDAAILRGQFVDVTAEGLLYLAAAGLCEIGRAHV